MESRKPLESAAQLLSCLPSAEAEQLLQRLPVAQAEAIRRCVPANATEPAARRAVAQRFIRELTGGTSNAAAYRFDAEQRPFSLSFFARLHPAQIAAALAGERPSTTACALSLLPASKAAEVLTLLPECFQVDVVHHMLTAGPVADDVQRELADSLVETVSRQDAADCAARMSRDQLLAVLRCTDAATRQRLVDVVQLEGIQLDATEALTGAPS